MSDDKSVGNLRSCVLSVGHDAGISRERIDRDGDGKVTDVEAAEFYFGDDQDQFFVRALCHYQVGLRHPVSLSGQTGVDEDMVGRIKGQFHRFAHIVKSKITREGKEAHKRLQKNLRIYYQLTRKKDGDLEDDDQMFLFGASAVLERFDGRDQLSLKENLPVGAKAFDVLLDMEQDDRIAKSNGDESLIAVYRKKIKKDLVALKRCIPKTDPYYAYLASSLGRHIYKYRLKHNVGKAEYTVAEAAAKMRGSCTEYTYLIYTLCRVAGIPKEKLAIFNEDKVYIMAGKRVGHACLAVLVSKEFKKRGYYLVDYSRGKFDDPPLKGEVSKGDGKGPLAFYLANKSAVLSRKGKIREAYEMARLATKLWPSRLSYSFLVSSLAFAVDARKILLFPKKLGELWDELTDVCPIGSKVANNMSMIRRLNDDLIREKTKEDLDRYAKQNSKRNSDLL